MHIRKPNRATHTYRQKLCAPPARVFPLLCPVREIEWAAGWLPDLVVSSSGVAERDCVFITPDEFGTATWYVTRHEPEKWFIEMLKILPGITACRLEIQLIADGLGISIAFANFNPDGSLTGAGKNFFGGKESCAQSIRTCRWPS